MSNKKIRFNHFDIHGYELEYIKQAINNGHVSSDGYFTRKCNTFLEKELTVGKSLLTTSCTHSLEMSAILLNIKSGDEIIMPSFTFVSTANAFVIRGAKPIFIDIRSDTLNMDEHQLEGLITERTKAIVPVHYAGVGCEMDIIMEIANRYDIPVVEDNAHGLFGKYKEKYLGTFGTFATQSFHETKNFSCGEGGALLINNKEYIDRAEIICEKGTDRSKFFRNEIDKYTWVDIGSSFLPSDILAAILFAQFEQRDKIQAKRKNIWETYYDGLINWAKENNVRLPFVPDYCKQTYHMFYLLFDSEQLRDHFLTYMNQKGISAIFHYIPLHSSKMGKKYCKVNCPETESISKKIIRLPFFSKLGPEIDEVINTIIKFNCSS